MWHGILIIDKERGLTSHQLVARLRRILKQSEVGHTGTLDPEATGVLVVGLGQATRSFMFLNETIKIYRAEIIIGQATDTQDATGRVLAEKPESVIGLDQLQVAITPLTGEIDQIPPMFSAVKIDGHKLYDLARRGEVVDRKARKIKVWNWSILDPQASYGYRQSVLVEITCSKGTYVRTLIHDLGEQLGCGAHMGKLVRLKSGDFSLDDSVTADQVQEYFVQGRMGEIIVSLNTALSHLHPIWLQEDDLEKVAHGGKLSFSKYPYEAPPDTPARVLDRFSKVIAVVQLSGAGLNRFWQPVKVFNYGTGGEQP
jgi:tRNA pseudouridine55 synthase